MAIPGEPLKAIVAFTGRLASMTHSHAFQIVRQRGGTPRRTVTQATEILVVGQLGWPLSSDGTPSASLHRARRFDVCVASERQFLEWIGKEATSIEPRPLRAEALATLAGLNTEHIARLTLCGLLDGRDGRYRFRDLVAARQLAELLAAGMPLRLIVKTVAELTRWLPDLELSKLQLYPVSRTRILVGQLNGRTDQHGQFELPIEDLGNDPDWLFEQAQWAENVKDIEGAERLYRLIMRLDPDDGTAAFNLGNLLRSLGRAAEAEAALRAAVKAQPDFTEAWFNLADLLDRGGRGEEAIACLRHALAADPTYADASFNLALLLQRRCEFDAAIGYWRQYLVQDRDSQWASCARRALKRCEIELQACGSQGVITTADPQDCPQLL